MTKYEAFVQFMDNLQQNKADLIAKLANSQDKVSLFSIELENAKVMSSACDGNISELHDNRKESPTDIGLAAEEAIWITRKKEYGDRVDITGAALVAAQKEYDALILKNKDLDYTSYAEEAVLEMNVEVKRLYAELCDKLTAASAARKVYLGAIAELNKVRNAGRNTVECGQKAASYAKVNKIENSMEHFSFNARQFLVSEGDVLKA
jgi:hypothetical protein